MFQELGMLDIPQDLNAEQAVLGTLLIENEKMDLVREWLTGDEFYNKSHEIIYRRMIELSNDGQAIDTVTLVSELHRNQELADIGGVEYITKLAQSVPSTANVEQYAEIVREKHLRRTTIKESMSIIQQAATGEAKEVIERLQRTADRLSNLSAPAKGFTPIKDVLMSVYEDAEERYRMREENRGITGLATGFIDLDKMTSGFQKSDLIIVAARPSVGKTAFALNVAQNVGKITQETVAIFSLEMSAKQLVQRMVCAETNLDANRMRTGYYEDQDWERLANGTAALSVTNIHIDDTPGLNVFEIRSRARKLQKEEGLGMIIIDYLQLINGRGRSESRQQEVSEISRTLKQLARELNVPIIALSQLSRGVEQRQDKRPMMSDLRESGAIEQDADIVAFLYRDDYYDKQSEKKDIIEIIIAKQRNGPVGTVELVFMKQYNKFVNLNRGERRSDPKPPHNPYYAKKRREKEDEE